MFRSLGAICESEGKNKFNTVFRELMKGDLSKELKESLQMPSYTPPLETPYVFPLPQESSVFSYKLVIGTKSEWQKWEEDIDTSAPLPRDIYACQVRYF